MGVKKPRREVSKNGGLQAALVWKTEVLFTGIGQKINVSLCFCTLVWTNSANVFLMLKMFVLCGNQGQSQGGSK